MNKVIHHLNKSEIDMLVPYLQELLKSAEEGSLDLYNEDEYGLRAFVCPPNAATFCTVCIAGLGNTGVVSTDCTSGSLVVNGGAGINGDLNVCGYINANDEPVIDPELKNYKLNGLTILDSVDTNLSVGFEASPVANGFGNTFVGSSAGSSSTPAASANTAVGNRALSANTNGNNNTALGNDTLAHNIGGLFNTAAGSEALFFNVSGNFNTAFGNSALFTTVSNNSNTSVGFGSLFRNIADENTAVGSNSLSSNTTGFFNTAMGSNSLANNSEGQENAAFGHTALFSCTGSFNVAVGSSAGATVASGNNNTIIGSNADAPTFDSCIVLGSDAVATASNQLVIASVTNPVGPISIVAPAPGTLAATGAIGFLPIVINGIEYSLALFNP